MCPGYRLATVAGWLPLGFEWEIAGTGLAVTAHNMIVVHELD
jgi:hypothetical protein